MTGALRHEEAPLVDILDRLLERGAAIEGDLVLSLADVELVWLGLRAVVGGIEHAPAGARLDAAYPAGRRTSGAAGRLTGAAATPAPGRSGSLPAEGVDWIRPSSAAGAAPDSSGSFPAEGVDRERPSFAEEPAPARSGSFPAEGVSSNRPRTPPAGAAPAPAPAAARTTEDGLVRLVLSVVELVRQLMERQALRRAEDGSLTDEQLDRLGTALLRLDERMSRLREQFGLEEDDLELTLGATSAA